MSITFRCNTNKAVVCLIFILSLASTATAETTSVPEELTPAFEQMIALAGKSAPNAPDAQHVNRLIGFLNRNKDPQGTFVMGGRDGASSNYSEFRLNRPFNEVLDLIYNPDIPAYLTSPASVRRSEWIRINGKQQQLPLLSGVYGRLTKTTVYTGVEFVENTPDTFSGAYYAYELDRALVLTRHEGRNVLISISRQRNKSDVGKKGLVLGDDDNWNYLYTDEKGCTKTGLGWADTYMYNSASITVYYEVDGPAPHVHIGVFKWLKAGWANINMVQPHHIKNGVKRFAKNFKALIESPAMADTSKLTEGLRQFENMPEETLRQKVKRHYLGLKKVHEIKSRRILKWFDSLGGKDGYLAKMTPKEMKAVLEKAYLKKVLGKRPIAGAGQKVAENPTNRRDL